MHEMDARNEIRRKEGKRLDLEMLNDVAHWLSNSGWTVLQVTGTFRVFLDSEGISVLRVMLLYRDRACQDVSRFDRIFFQMLPTTAGGIINFHLTMTK